MTDHPTPCSASSDTTEEDPVTQACVNIDTAARQLEAAAGQQRQCPIDLGDGCEVVVGVSRGPDGGVQAAADEGELTGQAEQGREDVTFRRLPS